MLAELARYLTTPCPWPLRRMGYLSEAIGLEARYRRCRAAWEPHLAACRDLIREAAEGCTRRRRAVVLGSGGLHDLPLADLARRFDEVVLADLVHLPPVRRRLRPLANVRAVVFDATGVVEGLAGLGPGEPLPAPETDLLSRFEADLIVSANLLCQLPVCPRLYLERRGGRTPEDLDAFARALVDAHLEALSESGAEVCLISEVEHLLCDEAGTVVERDPPLDGVSLSLEGREWVWDIAPHPEADPRLDLRYRVVGTLFRGA